MISRHATTLTRRALCSSTCLCSSQDQGAVVIVTPPSSLSSASNPTPNPLETRSLPCSDIWGYEFTDADKVDRYYAVVGMTNGIGTTSLVFCWRSCRGAFVWLRDCHDSDRFPSLPPRYCRRDRSDQPDRRLLCSWVRCQWGGWCGNGI